MVIMGQLRAVCQSDLTTQKTKAKNVARQQSKTQYRFGGHRICQATFLFLHSMSVTRFNAIKRSWLQSGLLPRVRSTTLPHNTTQLSDIRNVVRFILQYAEDHAILLPGRIPGYKRNDIQVLPSSTTKRQVWEAYHHAISQGPGTVVSYSLFCSLWRQLTPQVLVMCPMSDLCLVCQQNSTLIMRAHNRPVEKSEVLLLIISYTSNLILYPTGTTQSRAAPASCHRGEIALPTRTGEVQEAGTRPLSPGGSVCPSTTPRDGSTC